MQILILAGGKGARLKPYTTVFPKPLMPIGEFPILEVVIRQLKYYGAEEVIMAVGHQKELIRAFFNSGERWDLKIRYSFEEKPLGTAGPIRIAKNLKNNFIVMNGDILTDIDFKDFFNYHEKNDAVCTIATYSKPVNIDLGVIQTDKNGLLTDYIEKPTLHYNVSMGIYAFNKEIIEFIPENQNFDFPDLIKKLIKKKMNVQSYNFDGYWLDIGRPEDYEKAVVSFETHKKSFLK